MVQNVVELKRSDPGWSTTSTILITLSNHKQARVREVHTCMYEEIQALIKCK